MAEDEPALRRYVLLRRMAPFAAILGLSLVFSLVNAFRDTAAGAWEAPLAFGVLAGLIGCHLIGSIRYTGGKTVALGDRVIAWAMLLSSPVLLWLLDTDDNVAYYASLLLFVLAFCGFYGGLRAMETLFVPLFICFMVIPFQETLLLACSYPLRLFSTVIAAETLGFFGCDLHYVRTTITVGQSAIAVTDACSGINQLAVLFLFGYLIVRIQHRLFRWRVLHYLLLLPVIIAANAIRLMVTILLFYQIGEDAFGSFWHISLGYLLVVLSVLMLWGVGMLFPDQEVAAKEDAAAKEAQS